MEIINNNEIIRLRNGTHHGLDPANTVLLATPSVVHNNKILKTSSIKNVSILQQTIIFNILY